MLIFIPIESEKDVFFRVERGSFKDKNLTLVEETTYYKKKRILDARNIVIK